MTNLRSSPRRKEMEKEDYVTVTAAHNQNQLQSHLAGPMSMEGRNSTSDNDSDCNKYYSEHEQHLIRPKSSSSWKQSQRHRSSLQFSQILPHRTTTTLIPLLGSTSIRKMGASSFLIPSLLLLSLLSAAVAGQPSMQDSVRSPVTVAAGENAPLTCVVRDLGEATVVWKKWENGKAGPKILSAGETRVTSDERVKIIHDNGGDVWVLAITQSKVNDSGLYICEVNTTPVLRSFHNLTVISADLTVPHPHGSLSPPNQESTELNDYTSYKGMGSIVSHNYTDCCKTMNVSSKCWGFCTLQAILEGSTGEPTQCEDEFPRIVKCMADGRDHVPCCIHEQVPDICQDLCRGEYTVVTDNVKTHFSCPTYIERTLGCIADGIEILPSQPLNVDAIPINPTTINLTWTPPKENGHTVHEYVVNVTMLRSFDAPYTGVYSYGYASSTTAAPAGTDASPSSVEAAATTQSATTTVTVSSVEVVDAKMHQIKVPGEMNKAMLDSLQPFTMYEISVTAFNIHGKSLPSNRVRSLTLAPGVKKQDPKGVPNIPDIKNCCISKGVNTEFCVNKLCDPKQATEVEIPDLMICAPWTPHVFSCLADGKDHTPCCRSRGIPSPCFDLCSGNITKLDYHYFKCLRYMSEYSNCLLEGYDVLPSAPQHVRISNVQEDFAIVAWAPPKKLNETIKNYLLYYRQISTINSDYQHLQVVHPPYVLENLYANTEYEIYVEAVNDHGVSQPSQRVVFRTLSSHEIESKVEAIVDNYNETACCVSVGINPTCMPLCSYDASMSDIRSLAFACTSEFHNLLRCAAGGRDHSACCTRRGVSESCLDICTARVPDSLLSMAENCLPYIGNIVQCFEEGTELILGPVEDFHSNLVTSSSVSVTWVAPKNYNVSNYQVFYQLRHTASTNTSVETEPAEVKSVNTTDTSVTVTGLTTNKVYRFFVVAQNSHGSSIPSSVILVNVSEESYNGTKIPGLLAPPHSLLVAGHSATWVQIVWQPPVFSYPSEKITYKIYSKGVKDPTFQKNETTVNSITLDSYLPNSQHIIYVTASNDKGESEPSETLIAWTDPAHSPFPPRISPANLLVEGGVMTAMCVALGDPTPTISLYVNGKLIKQKKNRHVSETVRNITRDMKIVTCYADNGYGTPMQSARTITISHAPDVTASTVNTAVEGDTATIECNVVAHPAPKVSFWKNAPGQQNITSGGNYLIEHSTVEPLFEEQSVSYRYLLKIRNVSSQDAGNYTCHAQNSIGEAESSFTLQTKDLPDLSSNLTECCIREKVSPGCMDACSFDLDVASVIDKPQCLPDFDKLMKCSSDGRDHRACCSSWGVPRRCLNWCRGEPVTQHSELCVLQNFKVMVNCFKENKDKLPGPPQNLKVKSVSDTEVLISWDPPTINPTTASSYRVFWRQVNTKQTQRLDTQSTSATITHLQPGVKYEAVVKAGNSLGTSVLTEPISFYSEDNLIHLANHADGSHAGMGVGIAFLVFIVIGMAIGTAWFLRKRQFGAKPPTAIAFENPTYARDSEPAGNGNGPTPNGNGTTAAMNGNGSTPSSNSNGNGMRNSSSWQTEDLHPVRTETEVPPTLYEELRLGSEGAGFRRLK